MDSLELFHKYGLVPVISGGISLIITLWFNRKSIKWKLNTDKELAKLNGELHHKNATMASLIDAQKSNYSSGQERRILAIDNVWKEVCEFVSGLPTDIIFIYNMLTEEEISTLLTHDYSNNAFMKVIIHNTINTNYEKYYEDHKVLKNKLNRERPFLGEDLWFSFNVYIAVLVRILHYAEQGIRNQKLMHWYNDEASLRIISNIWSDIDLDYLTNNKLRSIEILKDITEGIIMNNANDILSGNKASKNSIKHLDDIYRTLKL